MRRALLLSGFDMVSQATKIWLAATTGAGWYPAADYRAPVPASAFLYPRSRFAQNRDTGPQ